MDIFGKKTCKCSHHGKIPLHVQASYLDRLGMLLKKGYTITDALNIIRLDPTYANIATATKSYLTKGRMLSETFQQLHFSNFAISFIAISIHSRDLGTHLQNCSKYLQQHIEFYRQFKKVMTYPTILLLFTSIILLFVNIHLLPTFHTVYADLSIAPVETSNYFSLMTTILIFLLYPLLLAIPLVVFFYRYIVPNIHNTSIQFRLYVLPICKPLKQLEATYFFSYHISCLLRSGCTIKESLEIIASQQELPIVQQYAEQFVQSFREGTSLIEVMNRCSLLKREFPIIFQQSLESGTISRDLEDYAHILLESFQDKMKKFVTILQPTVYLLFAFLIIFIYSSIVFPLFQLIEQI
nr:type II secretion system F family protein [Salirhabdus salicampi]